MIPFKHKFLTLSMYERSPMVSSVDLMDFLRISLRLSHKTFTIGSYAL